MGVWIWDKFVAYLQRGIANPDDPDDRRITAISNVSSIIGRLACGVFAVIAYLHGRYALAGALVGALILIWISVVMHHRSRNVVPSAFLAVLSVAALFIYMLATGGDEKTGFVWAIVFPPIAMFNLGRVRGAVVTMCFVVATVVVLFWIDPGSGELYPAALRARIIAATLFSSVLAFFFEHSRTVTYGRLKAEIEERKRVEEALRVAKERAVRTSVAKSDFLAKVSHELRTPLTGVIGLNELLLDTEMSEEQRKYAEASARSGRSLMRIINDVLDLAKVEAGKLVLETIPFDLRELVEAVIEMQGPIVQERKLEVVLAYQPDAPRYVVGDPSRIRQVLINLVTNAVKFTRDGHVIIRVDHESMAADRVTMRVSVEDTGIGLSEDQRDLVFDTFSQADSSTARRFGGSGLGLTISRQLVEAMGGEIGVLSELGKGSTFWFRLPLDVARRQTRETNLIVAGEPHFDARVLLAEDHALSRMVLCETLERLGCTVDEAVNGEQAVALFLANHYNLVLIDIQMPVLDGYAAVRRMRAEKKEGRGGVHTPIVAITANALGDDVDRCRAAGMDDRLIKPLMREDIVAALARYVVHPEDVSAQSG